MPSEGETRETFLVWGASGWIGSMLMSELSCHGVRAIGAASRLENIDAVTAELDAVSPTRVILAAGLTGRPNVDWCESHKLDVVRINVTCTLSLFDACNSRNIHVTYIGTGCIYEYDDSHPIGGLKFTEDDAPNFTGSFYSKTRGMVNEILRSGAFPNVSIMRHGVCCSSLYPSISPCVEYLVLKAYVFFTIMYLVDLMNG